MRILILIFGLKAPFILFLQDLIIYEGHESPVSGIDFSPDGRLLASASCDNNLKL
jgi:WD40 repeat protein